MRYLLGSNYGVWLIFDGWKIIVVGEIEPLEKVWDFRKGFQRRPFWVGDSGKMGRIYPLIIF